MQANNSIPPIVGSPPWEQNEAAQDALRALGVTQFVVGKDTNWYQVMGGLIVQGGYVTAATADAITLVSFNASFTQKVMGIFVTPIYPAPFGASNDASGGVKDWTLDSFNLLNDGTQKDFFWFAIGV